MAKEPRVVRSVKNSRKTSKKEAKTTSKEKSSNEYKSVEDLLAAFTGKQIDEILTSNDAKTGKNKKDSITLLTELAEELGNDAFLNVLQNGGVKLLRQVAEDLEIKATASRKKEQLAEEIRKEYEELGQTKFLKKLSLECLNDICEEMDFNEADASKDQIEEAIVEESFILGLKAAFVKLSKDSLVKAAKDVEVHHTGNKEKVAMNIISLAYSHLKGGASSDDEGPKKTTGPKLAKIEAGVTSEDLMQYYVKDLTNYCDANGLRKSGGKSAIIKNILKFLDGDIEGTRKLKPGERRKKRRGTKKGAQKRKRDESSSDESDQEDEKADDKKNDDKEDDDKEDEKEKEEEKEKEKEKEKTKSTSSRASKRTRF